MPKEGFPPLFWTIMSHKTAIYIYSQPFGTGTICPSHITHKKVHLVYPQKSFAQALFSISSSCYIVISRGESKNNASAKFF